MNKKVLVFALALLVAFAGSAMAAVEFSGKFKAEVSSDKLNFEDGLKLVPEFSVDVGLASADGEEDDLNWEFSAGVSLDLEDSKFEIGKYELGLYDQYFKAWVWGNEKELSDKNTPFKFVSAPKKAKDIRARVEVPVLDLAAVTLDFDPADNLKAFVDAEVEGFDVGLAYALEEWSADMAHTLAIYGKGDADALGVKAEAGVKLGEDMGMAFGLGADYDVTEELEVNGSVVYKNEYWNEEATTVLGAGATYEEIDFQVSLDGEVTLKDSGNENEIGLKAYYRFSDAVAFNKLFAGKEWFKNDAPAVGVSVDFEDLAFAKVRVDAAAPLVEDMVWLKAYGVFESKNDFGAGLLGHVLASDKLTVKPSVDYEQVGVVIDAKLAADYKIGLSDTVLALTVQKVFTEDGHVDKDGDLVAKELVKASVTVPF
ncbi:MAG: hypothetical protein GX335_07615 [Firmicutes bacterium]|nr:hypothetical protein [Bacillota bacterium]